MRALHSKLLNDLWQMRWQNMAIALVLAAGVSIVVMSFSTLQSLEENRTSFYSRSQFGNCFIHLKRAPMSLVERLRQIEGVTAVEARVVMPINLSVPGFAEPATGRIVSLPDHQAPQVNRLYLRAGRMLEPHRPGEVLVSEAFATAHRFRPGDSVSAIINGKQRSLSIAGIVLSPEYVYSVRPGELLPDDRRFGILWMGYEELSAAADLHNAFNSVAVTMMDPKAEQRVLDELDSLLAAHGGSNAYGRDLQPSHRFMENELIQLRTMALVPPAIFLTVTIFLIQIVMSRLVTTQREQIATMRAFGYTRSEIAGHYLAFALVIGSLGLLMGIGTGAKLGADLTALYTRFFRLPVMTYHLDWRLVVATITAGVLSVLAGVWQAVWRATSVLPAQAMQPPSPPLYRVSVLERLVWMRYLPQTWRMIVRHLGRYPLRSSLTTIGIALSIGILVMGNFVQDTVDHVMDFQFHTTGRQDLRVTFVEPAASAAISELKTFPGVMQIEPFRAVAVRLSFGQHQRRMELVGLPGQSQLIRVVDPHRGPIELPNDGLVISRRLAQIFGCELGNEIRVQVLEGSRSVKDIPIVAIIDDYLDLNATIHIESLHRLLREQPTVSGAALSVDAKEQSKLYHRLQQTPRVAGVSIKRADIQTYQNTMAENLLRMKLINVLFASVVAVGVVYNCARISLTERSRELATLRVLGFTRKETSFILLGELALLILAAIPLGVLMGYGLAWILSQSLQTELHRFPLVIRGRTYAFAVTVVMVSSVASALIVRRRMDQFNLVEVLKARD